MCLGGFCPMSATVQPTLDGRCLNSSAPQYRSPASPEQPSVWALVWAIRSGQFDDLESHGWSVVLDDDQRPPGDPDDDEKAQEEQSEEGKK